MLKKFNLYIQNIIKQNSIKLKNITTQDAVAGMTVGSVMGPGSPQTSIANTSGVNGDSRVISFPGIPYVRRNKRNKRNRRKKKNNYIK